MGLVVRDLKPSIGTSFYFASITPTSMYLHVSGEVGLASDRIVTSLNGTGDTLLILAVGLAFTLVLDSRLLALNNRLLTFNSLLLSTLSPLPCRSAVVLVNGPF